MKIEKRGWWLGWWLVFCPPPPTTSVAIPLSLFMNCILEESLVQSVITFQVCIFKYFYSSYFAFNFSPGSINVDAKLYLLNATSIQRLQLCRIVDSFLNKNSDNLEGLNVDSLSTVSLGNAFYNTFKC